MKEKNKDVDVGSLKDLKTQEREIINLIREIGFGEIRLTIRDGVPVRIEEYKRSVKL